MKIGFDAKRYFHNRTGLGNYSRDLLKGLYLYFPDNHYFLFDEKPNLNLLPQNTIAVVPKGQKFLWREHGMIQDMKLYQLEVFHGLSNELPFGKYPESIKKLVTIHDVIFQTYPEHYGYIDRTIYHQKTRHAIKIADTIIATSKATSNDLIKFYNANEQKIKVVYQTCGDQHKTNYSDLEIASFKTIHQLQQPYLLYVSSFQTRKNHLPLIKAFGHLKQTKVKLVLAGRKGETYDDCKKMIKSLGLEKMVNLVDDISHEDLPLLYRGAQGFIYPSMIEGFGIPLIEAAFAGLPMAVNDIEVFKEIAPQGTLFFDINNQVSIIKSLNDLLKTDKQLTDYKKHLQLFNSDTLAKQMQSLYSA